MNKSRRTFIKQSSVILAGAALLPSFKVEASSIKKKKLAIQLFAVDSLMNSDIKNTLQFLRSTGYQYIEHSNYLNRKFYGYTPSDFRKLVYDCGLKILSGHTVLELKHWDRNKKTFTTGWRQIIEDASIAGQEYIISPWLDKSLWYDEIKLKNFLQVFNKCGELCKREGLKFGYHNHDFEFSHYLNGTTLYDIILQYTDGRFVNQQLDIGNIDQRHFSLEGLLQAYPNRFQLLHLKNIVESPHRHELYTNAALNSGKLDLNHIIDLTNTHGGTCNYVMDQGYQESCSVLDDVKLDYELIRQSFGMLHADFI